jgi:hypothetical protein
MTGSSPLPTGRQARTTRISTTKPLPLDGGGRGGGEVPRFVPPHLHPLPRRGEERVGTTRNRGEAARSTQVPSAIRFLIAM